MDLIDKKTNFVIEMPKNYIEYIVTNYIYISHPFNTFILNKDNNIFQKYANNIIDKNKFIDSYADIKNVLYLSNNNIIRVFIKNLNSFNLSNNNIFHFRDALYFKIRYKFKKYTYITINIDVKNDDLSEFYYLKGLLYCIKKFNINMELLKIIIINDNNFVLNNNFDEKNKYNTLFNFYYDKIFKLIKIKNDNIVFSNEMFNKAFNNLDSNEYKEILYSNTNFNIVTNDERDIAIALTTLNNNKYNESKKIIYPKKLLNIKLENNNIIGI